jgi:uroporphyrinogen-III decarboxylase
MTTGVEILGTRLAEAGVDVLYFVDPVQDGLPLEKARELLGGKITLVGGINALSLAPENWDHVEEQTRRAIEVLGPTNRFILHPVDAIFPDTPWEGVERLIEAWKKHW